MAGGIDMTVFRYGRVVMSNPAGRLLSVLVGVLLIGWLSTIFLWVMSILWWSIPAILVIWGLSRFYLFGFEYRLTVIAGFLLIVGGASRALFQLVSLSEFTGAIANLVPALGIFAEMFADHYRNQD